MYGNDAETVNNVPQSSLDYEDHRAGFSSFLILSALFGRFDYHLCDKLNNINKVDFIKYVEFSF